ncbi:hypothetical protein VmeM32_00046 [Vibrio phage vB_VmeM-32]|nr:hypothetical protein VmeM32_00046 [Vibrio phage vB_VmeM-32]
MENTELFIGTFSGIMIMIYVFIWNQMFSIFSEVLAIETKTYNTYYEDTETEKLLEGKPLHVTKKIYKR